MFQGVVTVLESFDAGLSSVKGDLELSVPVCSASTLGLSRGFVGTPLKFAVQWGPRRDIDPSMFLLARCGRCR